MTEEKPKDISDIIRRKCIINFFWRNYGKSRKINMNIIGKQGQGMSSAGIAIANHIGVVGMVAAASVVASITTDIIEDKNGIKNKKRY